MARNFAAERKRIRDEYEARITDCRAQMDQSWEAKRVRYMPRTDDPFEDVRLRGERMDALFEEVTARNQRVERLRHERDCKLLKLGASTYCAADTHGQSVHSTVRRATVPFSTVLRAQRSARAPSP